MARIKPQEIGRRTATATRESNSPDLVVHADLDAARGYQALSSVAIGVLGKVSDAMANRHVEQFGKDMDAGSTARMQQDVTGTAPSTKEEMDQQTDGWRRGYLKADGALKLRDWQTEATKQMMQAEPGTDIEPMLKESLNQLMAGPEFQDQHVKQALMPAVQRAADNVRQSWKQTEVKEIFDRQQESLTEIASAGIKDGSLLTDGGMEKLYKSLDSADYAYLNRHDVDDIFAEAAKRTLATGETDPQKVMEFLGRKLPGNGTSVLNGKHGDDLRVAAARGQAVRKQAADEAQDQALADAEFKLQGLADRGQLTDKHIDGLVDQFSLKGRDALTFKRYWSGQQQQTLDKWQRESEKRDKKAEVRLAMSQGRYFDLSQSQIQDFAHDEWIATPPEQRPALMDKYSKIGVPIPQIKNMLDRATPNNPEWFRNASEMYHQLRDKDPQYAATYVSEHNAGLFEAHWRNVKELGLSESDSIKDLGTDKFKSEEAQKQIGMAWKDQVKKLPKRDDGFKRDGLYMERVRTEAERIAAATPQVSAQDAIMAADQRISTQYTQVAGRTVLNLGMPKGAEKATETLLEGVQERMGDALPKGTKLAAAVNPYDTSQWVVTNDKGFPVDDPDTGRPIVFSPSMIAAAHNKWSADLADSQTRKAQAMRQFNEQTGKRKVFNSSADDYDSYQGQRSQLADLEKQLAKNPNDNSGWAHQTRARVDSMRKDQEVMSTLSKDVTNVPASFTEYLKGVK